MGNGAQNFLLRISIWLAVPAFVLSLVGVFRGIWPKIVISAPPQTVDSSTGMPLFFKVQNTGVLKAYSPRYRCYFAYEKAAPPAPADTIQDSVSGEYPLGDALLSDDPVETDCRPVAFNGALASEADVAILVSFRPEFYWRRGSACGRFVLKHLNNGQLAWLRKSSERCPSLSACLDRRYAAARQYHAAMRGYLKKRRANMFAERPKVIAYVPCLPKE